MKNRIIELTEPEYQHFRVTLEGVAEELEDLMKEHAYYTTELPDRVQTCLEILSRAK